MAPPLGCSRPCPVTSQLGAPQQRLDGLRQRDAVDSLPEAAVHTTSEVHTVLPRTNDLKCSRACTLRTIVLFYAPMGKGEETRREILGNALALASEVGLSGLSIGLLAERVGMSKSGLFAHFASKERLQVAVLEEASARFVARVVAPALKSPRGRPRVLALFEHWLKWEQQIDIMPGGCVFMAASAELDDQPGPARDQLVSSQRDWQETVAQAARIAKREGHFHARLDELQFAFELYGIMSSYYYHQRLLRDEHAERRARKAFERLLADASAQPQS